MSSGPVLHIHFVQAASRVFYFFFDRTYFANKSNPFVYQNGTRLRTQAHIFESARFPRDGEVELKDG